MKKIGIILTFVILANSTFAQFELLNTFSKKSHRVIDAVFSPNAKYIATCGYDKTILIRDNQGTIIKNLTNLKSISTSAIFSYDSEYLISAGEEKNITVWDFKKAIVRYTLEGHKKDINAIAVSKNGIIASVSSDKTIKLWDINNGKLLRSINAHDDDITAVCFNSDGTKLATGGKDERIKIWETNTGAMLTEIKEAGKSIRKIKYTPDNRFLISNSSFQIMIWNTANGLLDSKISNPHGVSKIKSIDISIDGEFILCSSFDKKFSIWNMKTANVQSGREIRSYIRFHQ